MLYSERLLYKNANNESINIGYDFDLIPVSFDDSVDNALNTTKFALQDGSTFVSSSLSDRAISVTFTYAIRNAVAIEKEVARVVNPMIEGTLYKINSFGTKQIKVRPLSTPQIVRLQGRAEITLDLQACEPFYQTETVIERMVNRTPMMRFPLHWSTVEERLFGVYVDVLDTAITNNGDVDTGFTLTFKAGGRVVNPSITNKATGEKIRLKLNMELGDTVQVVNMPFHKEIIVNGVKQFSALDRNETTFFSLLVGKNSLSIDADENVTNLTAFVEYAPKYLL